jgi:acyl transferase domain-containing protein
MAGRFPKAATVEQFWHNLKGGVEAISFFTDEELEAAGARFPRNNPSYVKARGVLEQAEFFDASFFGFTPKEAEIMDPQHRVFLECCWEALENAGYDSEASEEVIGVFAGMSMNTYLLSNLATHPDLLDLVGHYQVMLANDKDFLPTRVSYKLNLRGPSVSIQTACSTSLVAVCMACQNLLNYQCDMALAGGVSIGFPQKRGYLFNEGGIVSPDGHCRAFDARAQGTVAGEGAGVVVLKRAEEAIADGDPIYAIIKGFAINNDGALKMGYTAPSADGQAEVVAMAQAVAGVEPESIQYVVAHGTGTPLGDPIEVAGLTKAFRAGGNANAKGFCALTSVKSNIGHLDAAAGVASLINAALALEHRVIPPSLHFEKPNPKLELANSPFFINSRLAEWKAGSSPRRAGVSSFGIGGTNAHVILEESPPASASGPSRPMQLMLISAKTASALDAATARLADHLQTNPGLNLADAAWTLQTGRRAFRQRRMLVCGNAEEAAEVLRSVDPKRVLTRVSSEESPSLVFMFPGQGAQSVNMGAELYRTEPIFREQIDLCASILEPHLGLDLRSVLYPPEEQTEQAKAQLTQTALTQPAIFTINYALAKLWMSWGIQPQAMIGHSVGEFVAACLAGVFSLDDALALVAGRARLVQQQSPGSMLAVRLAENDVAAYLNGHLSLAAVNSPSLCVVSGPDTAIDELQQQLRTRGIAAQRLHTSHAFHSPMMEPVLGPLTDLVRKIRLKPPRIPYVSNLTGDWITAEQALDPGYWARHMREKVRFAEGVQKLLQQPGRILLETGPGQGLSMLARQCPAVDGEKIVLSSLPAAQSRQSELNVMLHSLGQLWLAGVPIDWKAFNNHQKRRRVRLPAYPFERKRYWVEPAKLEANATVQAAATLIAAAAIPTSSIGETPSISSNSVSATVPQGRKELIAVALHAILSDLSGLTASQLDRGKTFIEMGFDSLFLTQTSQAIEKRLGVRVAFADLLEKYSSIETLATHLEKLIPPGTNLSLLSPAAKAPAVTAAATVRIGARGEIEGVLAVPLTEAQKELWYATLVSEKASCVFNESMALALRGPLDVPALRKALQLLVDRHEALRTSISPVGDEQKIFPRVRLEVPLIDLSSLEPARADAEFQTLLEKAAATAFDLSKPPLLRCQLVRRGPDDHSLIFAVHHIICDGGSVLILMDELAEFYSACHRGGVSNKPSAVQFSEYARAQARSKGNAQKLADEAYWLQQFSAPPRDLELPADNPRPAKPAFNARRVSRQIDPVLAQNLKRLSAQQNCTFFTTLLSAYFVFLEGLTGQDDLVVGVPMAVRDGIETLVGHCVNFLPLRGRMADRSTFNEHLSRVRKIFFEAFEHQNYTFGSLIQKLKLPRSSSRMPLLSATFNLARGRGELKLDGLQAQIIPNPNCFAHFDITFDVIERERELEVNCTYNSDLFHGQTIERWLAHFETLLAQITANPRQQLGEFAQLFAAERRQQPTIASAPSANAPVANGSPENSPSRSFTPTEKVLSEIWTEVIGLEEVGVHDNFFELGGHSVLVTQIIARVRKAFQVDLTLRAVFESPTIAGLAAEIEKAIVAEINELPEPATLPVSGELELSSKDSR